MITATAAATEMQNNFGKYLSPATSGQEIYLTDSLTGILKGDYDLDEAKTERLKEKYETAD